MTGADFKHRVRGIVNDDQLKLSGKVERIADLLDSEDEETWDDEDDEEEEGEDEEDDAEEEGAAT